MSTCVGSEEDGLGADEEEAEMAMPVRVKASGRVWVCQSMTRRPMRRKPRMARATVLRAMRQDLLGGAGRCWIEERCDASARWATRANQRPVASSTAGSARRWAACSRGSGRGGGSS